MARGGGEVVDLPPPRVLHRDSKPLSDVHQHVLAAVTAAGATAANAQGPTRALAVSPDGTRVVYRTFGPTGSLMEQNIEALRSE
jgi:hypothetical protein